MTIPVPSLSSSGWVSEIAEKADKLLSYFFVSEESQSNVYAGHITSLPGLIRRFDNDPSELSSNIQRQLTLYLERYFDTADVTATARENTDRDKRGLDIQVEIFVTEKGKEHSLGRLVSTLNSSIMRIVDLQNKG